MTGFLYDHIHLRSRDPRGTAEFYQRVLDARIIESAQPDGTPRIDLDLNGLAVFIARVATDEAMADAPPEPHLGLDHFGLRVDKLDETVAELKRRGASFASEPRTIRPGLRVAFLQCPDNVRIELLERSSGSA